MTRNLSPWWVQVVLDPTSDRPTEYEMYVLAENANQATYALTNHLRAERGLAPFQDGLGDFDFQTRRMPAVFAAVITRVADPLPPDEQDD